MWSSIARRAVTTAPRHWRPHKQLRNISCPRPPCRACPGSDRSLRQGRHWRGPRALAGDAHRKSFRARRSRFDSLKWKSRLARRTWWQAGKPESPSRRTAAGARSMAVCVRWPSFWIFTRQTCRSHRNAEPMYWLCQYREAPDSCISARWRSPYTSTHSRIEEKAWSHDAAE